MPRTRPLAVLVTVAALSVATACGQHDHGGTAASGGSSPDHSKMTMKSGESMEGMDMSSSREGPSKTAAMVCTEDEILDGVAKALGLDEPPARSHTWSDLVYTCTYQLRSGRLILAVKDSPTEASGRAYYRRLEASLPGATRLHGLQALGLPSFETRRGDVVFIKDGKTLHVDATRVPASALPAGSTRTEVAYQVATDVIACWSE